MQVIVLGSICAQTRRQVIGELLAIPGRTVLRYERAGTCLNRYAQGRGVGALAGLVQTLPVDGPVIGASLRDVMFADLPVALRHLAGAAVDQVVVVPPEGMDLAVALAALEAAGQLDIVASLAVAVDPAAVEDTLWARGTLSELGLACGAQDLRTPGDFLVANLLWADTVAMVDSAQLHTGAAQSTALLRHLAPLARIAYLSCRRFAWSGFDPREAQARTRPGAICLLAGARESDGMVSGLVTMGRPLHPARLVERMPAMSAGAVFSRGKVWIASAHHRRIAWWSVGPEIGFDDGGLWLSPTTPPTPGTPTQDALDWRPGFGDRGTAIAFTGRDLDLDKIGALFTECGLDDGEYAALGRGELVMADPFHLTRALASTASETSGGQCSTPPNAGGL